MHLADVVALCRKQASAAIYADSCMHKVHQLAKSYLEEPGARSGTQRHAAGALSVRSLRCRRASAAALRTPARREGGREGAGVLAPASAGQFLARMRQCG